MAVWFLANHTPATGPYFGFAEASHLDGASVNGAPVNATPMNSGVSIAGFGQGRWFNGGTASALLEAEFQKFIAEDIRAEVAALFNGVWEVLPETSDQAAVSGEGSDVVTSHQQMLERLNAVEEALAALSQPGMGHNRPPDVLEDEPLAQTDRQALIEVVSILKSERPDLPVNPSPVIEATSTLRSISVRVSAYLAEKGDVFVTEAVKAAGQETGKWVTRFALWKTLGAALAAAVLGVLAWFHSFGLPL